MKHTEIKTIKQLANYLRCSEEFLNKAIKNDIEIIEISKMTKKEYFFKPATDKIVIEKIHIKKKGKILGYRTVYAIKTFQLSDTLKILNNYLAEIFLPNDCVHGFVYGKSTRTNAASHLSKKLVLSVDIKDYFESISKDLISKSLTQIGFNEDVSEWISCITTMNNHLVQGYNTSPTIANIVTNQMDIDLLKICTDKVVYTRYADDLYFSSNDDLPNVSDIKQVIENYGFILNDSKTKNMKRGRFQFVTGLTVFDNKMPRIPKKIKRNIRLEIHCISKLGYEKHSIRRLKNAGVSLGLPEFRPLMEEDIFETNRRLFGWLHYIKSIEPKFAKDLYMKLLLSER